LAYKTIKFMELLKWVGAEHLDLFQFIMGLFLFTVLSSKIWQWQ